MEVSDAVRSSGSTSYVVQHQATVDGVSTDVVAPSNSRGTTVEERAALLTVPPFRSRSTAALNDEVHRLRHELAAAVALQQVNALYALIRKEGTALITSNIVPIRRCLAGQHNG